MEKETINFKKSLGQNFIFDINLLNAIVNDGGVESDDTVLEIGAGAGTLTSVLCKKAKQVISFEIDKSLSPYLDKLQNENKNLKIIYQDFMQADINALNLNSARVVANIPYYITTPIIFKLASVKEIFKSILILVQKEVALRFGASPKSKDYGITSVTLQAVFDVSIPRIVKKENFTPSPKVDSALCKLVPHNRFDMGNFEEFSEFVSRAFSMRRKTLINNLKNFYDKEKLLNSLKNLSFNENIRPEEIGVDNFVKLYKFMKNN